MFSNRLQSIQREVTNFYILNVWLVLLLKLTDFHEIIFGLTFPFLHFLLIYLLVQRLQANFSRARCIYYIFKTIKPSFKKIDSFCTDIKNWNLIFSWNFRWFDNTGLVLPRGKTCWGLWALPSTAEPLLTFKTIYTAWPQKAFEFEILLVLSEWHSIIMVIVAILDLFLTFMEVLLMFY